MIKISSRALRRLTSICQKDREAMAKRMLPSICLNLLISVIFLVNRVFADYDATSLESGSQMSTDRLIVLTSAVDLNQDSFIRFNRSIEAFNLNLILIRPEETTSKSDVSNSSNPDSTNSNDRLNNKKQFELLKKALSAYKDEHNLVIMLVDSSHSIVNGYEHEILAKFKEFNRTNGTRILFSADSVCWPDLGLAEKYPLTWADNDINDKSIDKHSQNLQVKRFLDSKSFIGYATTLWDLIETTSTTLKENDTSDKLLVGAINYDFQLYATHVYLNVQQRSRLNLELDHRSSLFENLNAADAKSPSWSSEIELEFIESADRVGMKNLVHNTRPLVVHGSGSAKIIELNSLGNYLGKAWTPHDGCRHCNSTMISLASIKDSDLPKVVIGVFIEEPTPFMENFFMTLRQLNYPKKQIHLFIHNAVEYHNKHVSEFLAKYGNEYASHELFDNSPAVLVQLTEAQARDYAMVKCKQLSCDYYLSLDSLARLEQPDSLRQLIETNRTVVAPLLSRPGKLWSNFWGAITHEGYYDRSHDYVHLVTCERVGVWNVPLIMNAYLIEGKFLRAALETTSKLAAAGVDGKHNESQLFLTYFDAKFPSVKPVLIFGRNLRSANVFQYVTNTMDFGHLIDPTTYNTSRLYPDFYELVNNKPDWERDYLHENYTDLFDERDEDEKGYPNRIRLEQPCQDVYWFPVVSERFCNQLIDIMEQFGRWSAGTNSDPRIEGGYESVPTRDIHFKQVGLHDLWLFFLREYVMPVQLKEYIGYEHDPPRTELAFVVRYHPNEQASLRPHHDSSTYTLNVALNTPGVDYEGGGCRFVRYNCSVTESRKGWALIHPGRLTHYHEGLPVTNGTRYILVTFVDP